MIFVDTWAWVALANRRDAYHAEATAYKRLRSTRSQALVTTTAVLTETISQLFKVLPPQFAISYLDNLMERCREGSAYHLVYVSAGHFSDAWVLRKRLADKPDISFTDLTSMVVMQELGITDVFTGDAHFEHVGLGFRRVPE